MQHVLALQKSHEMLGILFLTFQMLQIPFLIISVIFEPKNGTATLHINPSISQQRDIFRIYQYLTRISIPSGAPIKDI